MQGYAQERTHALCSPARVRAGSVRVKRVDCGVQALPQLQAKLRIERARMRLRLLAPLSAKPELDRLLAAQAAAIEFQDLGLNGQQACLAPPRAPSRDQGFPWHGLVGIVALGQLRPVKAGVSLYLLKSSVSVGHAAQETPSAFPETSN